MEQNPFAPKFEDLPGTIPVFPLGGVLLLPGGQLPLNIFEPRYIAMVDDALRGGRLIGMIQPDPLHPMRNGDAPPILLKTGCAGKITDFNETKDGRYLINLTGICRFDIAEETTQDTPYRRVRPDWSPYQGDPQGKSCLGLNRDHLHALLKTYFSKEELECDWAAIENCSDNKLITCLSMICPFEARDKQALLEAPCCQTRGELFIAMLEMTLRGTCSEAAGRH